MGILDFLAGEPDLNVATKLGVDPNSLAAFKQIQNQAETSALGPALVGGVLSALGGRRRGAGLRAIEGAGRAYTGAKQQAEQEPLQMATFAQNQRLANQRMQDAAAQAKLRQAHEQTYEEATQKHEDYLDWTMKNSPNAVVPADLSQARFAPYLASKNPGTVSAAKMLAAQPQTGAQLTASTNELAKIESALSHPGNHFSQTGSPETGYNLTVLDPNGNILMQHRINGMNAGPGAVGIPSKVESQMRQDYNKQMGVQEKNRQAKADQLAQKNNTLGNSTGHVSMQGYPLTYADWMATKDARDSYLANGGSKDGLAKLQAYAKTRILPGQVADKVSDSNMKKYPEKTPIFVPSKNYWVERRGNKWYRITAPLSQDPSLSLDPNQPGPATVGKKGMGISIDTAPSGASAPAPADNTNTVAPEGAAEPIS